MSNQLSPEAQEQHMKMTPIFDLINAQKLTLDDESSLVVTVLFNMWKRDPEFASRYLSMQGHLFTVMAATRGIPLPEIVVSDHAEKGRN